MLNVWSIMVSSQLQGEAPQSNDHVAWFCPSMGDVSRVLLFSGRSQQSKLAWPNQLLFFSVWGLSQFRKHVIWGLGTKLHFEDEDRWGRPLLMVVLLQHVSSSNSGPCLWRVVWSWWQTPLGVNVMLLSLAISKHHWRFVQFHTITSLLKALPKQWNCWVKSSHSHSKHEDLLRLSIWTICHSLSCLQNGCW